MWNYDYVTTSKDEQRRIPVEGHTPDDLPITVVGLVSQRLSGVKFAERNGFCFRGAEGNYKVSTRDTTGNLRVVREWKETVFASMLVPLY